MPTCPGCQQRIPYDRLDVHERYCLGIRGSDDIEGHGVRRLEERVDDVERRLDGRLRAVEARMERRTPASDDESPTLLKRDQ